ncbi:uncharacterized protein FIESC28_00615 [Fusarium coffeatum]|uniref:Protein kinase domain-containing protein n=1 Tax=Fusarium coffeatum TaxID=231269 RepID=A0A366SCI4_9HYPO|nr:uncharacterized protein FIESC28_00615 [Fusarium coffeatum]RBR26618.1 hypothetical protein FIESC28_00615 [Fusarium coffeatum]
MCASKGQAGQEPTLLATPTSIDDLFLVEYNDLETNNRQRTFLWMSEDDNVFFGRASTNDMTLDDYVQALEPVPDKDLFPELPVDTEITIALDYDESSSFCKRPGLFQFEPGFDFGTPKQVLDETLIMEKLAKNPHPNITHYKGCRVKRGRITGIVVDKNEMSLEQFIKSEKLSDLNVNSFLSDINSAVDHLHSLGMAHNDINPGNIMMGEKNKPVLIDFGSCQPFGKLLQTFGTPGWFEEDFWTSEKKHDDIALEKLRQWLKIVKPDDMIKSEL